MCILNFSCLKFTFGNVNCHRFRWVSLSYNEQLRLREEIMLYRTKVCYLDDLILIDIVCQLSPLFEHFNIMIIYFFKVGSSGVLLPVYIKERIACVIVELLKKMWPQEWSSFNMEIFSVMEKVTDWSVWMV